MHINCTTYHPVMLPSVLWHHSLDIRKSIRTAKRTKWWGAGVVICLQQGANDLHIWSSWCHCHCHPIISCFIKIQAGLTFLVPFYGGCPGKNNVKRVSYHPVIILITCGTEARAHGAIIAVLVDDVPQHVQLVLLGTQLRHRLLLQLASCLLLCFV